MLPILRALVGRLYAFYYYFGPLQEPLDAFFCKLASLARLNYGEKIHTDVRTSYRPRLLLCLYELEACNVCRQVREAMCVLDLDYICLPCPREHVVFDPTPKEGRWKMEALAKGQNAELPLLVDPNTEATLSGDNIVPYLWETYGPLLGEIDVTVVEAKNLSERPGNKRGGFSMAMGVQRKVFAEVVLTGCPVPALHTEVKTGTLDPRFDETFSYGVTSETQAVQITLKDKVLSKFAQKYKRKSKRTS